MKRLMIIFAFLCFGIAFGQFAEAPQYEFNSTSTYRYTNTQRHYTVPVSELQQPFYSPNDQYRVVHRSPGYPPADPDMHDTPIGDPPIIAMMVLVLVYIGYDVLVKPALNKE